jgi:hypothetical protein
MTNSFVYSWSDHKTAKVYVGVHKGHEKDGYICSSKYMIKEYKERPEDFTRQIIAKGDWKNCIVFEKKINEQLIKNIDTTYNRHAYPAIINDIHPMLGKPNYEGRVKAEKTINEKRKLDPEYDKHIYYQRAKGRLGKPSPRKGIKLSEETKNKISESNFWKGKAGPNAGRKFSEESKNKMKLSALKKAPPSEETRLKLSESIKLSWKKRKGIL